MKSCSRGQFIIVKGNWEIEMDFIAVNGEEIMDTKSAIIDSGIRFLIRETETVRQLMTGVDGAKDGAETIAPGFWSIPCDKVPTFSLSFPGKSWDIPPEKFNAGKVNGSDTDCVATITGLPIGDVWLIGDVLLRSVYTVFDFGAKRIGFAEYA